MFEDDDKDPGESPTERPITPAEQAKEKADEFRMHAELVAVFEGRRKYDAELLSNLDRDVAREVQRTIAKLEKAKEAETPLISATAAPDASVARRCRSWRG